MRSTGYGRESFQKGREGKTACKVHINQHLPNILAGPFVTFNCIILKEFSLRNIFHILLFMLLPVMFFGCKKSSSGNDIGQLLEQSGWFVHYYYDGTDKTA